MIRVTVKEMKKLGENNNTSGNEPTWTTQGGKTILVKDMSTTHILNSIKKIKSTGWRAGMLPILEEELTRRNLNVSGSAVVDIENLEIKKSEMEYFLETSCDYQIVDGKEHIYSHITTPISQDLVEYMKQSFAIPENMDKDDFIGKKALEEKGVPKRRRVGLKVTGRGIIREAQDVFVDDKKIGVTTSGTHCPYLKQAVALALVDTDYKDIGTKVQVNVRGRMVDAEVIKLPFYKRSK